MNPETGGMGSGGIVLSPYVDLKGFFRCHVVITLDAVAETITINPLQATDAAGAGAKALNIPRVYTKFGSEKNFTPVAVNADSYVITPATAGIVVAEFDVSTLDVNNGFQFLRMRAVGSTLRKIANTMYPAGGKVRRVAPLIDPNQVFPYGFLESEWDDPGSIGAGWSIVSPEAHSDGADQSNMESVGLSVDEGDQFQVNMELYDYVAGQFRFFIQGQGSATILTDNGFIDEVITAGAPTSYTYRCRAATVGSANDYKIRGLSVVKLP